MLSVCLMYLYMHMLPRPCMVCYDQTCKQELYAMRVLGEVHKMVVSCA
jgi:hypothetical protein